MSTHLNLLHRQVIFTKTYMSPTVTSNKLKKIEKDSQTDRTDKKEGHINVDFCVFTRKGNSLAYQNDVVELAKMKEFIS